MAPKRSPKLVVTKKTVQESVEIAIIPTNKKSSWKQQNISHTEETTTQVEEEQEAVTPPSKTTHINIEDKNQEQQPEQAQPATATETEAPTKDKKEKEKTVKKTRKRKRGNGDAGGVYKVYVFKVLKQVHPGLAISSQAMTVINNLMSDMFERIAYEATSLSKYHKKNTLSSREIQGAVKLVLPGDLGKHAVSEGNKAVASYMSYDDTKS